MATVLVVDDEADIRELVRINLEMEGHRVVLAADGAQALESLRRESPDLVILDVMMPGIDGWEVLGAIKADSDEALAQTPVMMLTARTDDMDRIKGAIEGAIRYVTKPFGVADLRTQVRDALSGDAEIVRRRKVQQQALEQLARIERGDRGAVADEGTARPRLTRLEQAHAPSSPKPSSVSPAAVEALSDKQRELLIRVAAAPTVRAAAEELEVSRSNVYASLRRIARKLGVRSVPELLTLARDGVIRTERPAD